MPETFAICTDQELYQHRSALSALLRASDGRDLTLQELAAVLPPRAPAGHYQNRVRGFILKTLNQSGFTHDGMRIS